MAAQVVGLIDQPRTDHTQTLKVNAGHQRYADETANDEQVARHVTQQCQQQGKRRTGDDTQTMTKHLTTIPYTIHHTETTRRTEVNNLVSLAQCRYPRLRQDKHQVPPAPQEHHLRPLHRTRGRRKAKTVRTATASLSMQKLANGEDGKKGAGRSDLQNVM